MNDTTPISNATPIAQYFLSRGLYDGDYMSNLKLQQLVFYTHAGALTCLGRPIRETQFEAWAQKGAIDPLLYQAFERFGTRPVDESFLDGRTIEEIEAEFTDDELALLENVYDIYSPMTGFELVMRIKNEDPWQLARAGLGPEDEGTPPIYDDMIRFAYDPEDFVTDFDDLEYAISCEVDHGEVAAS